MTTSLRERLRADTAERHDGVDHAYSTLDLAEAAGLRAFLRAQSRVLAGLRCRPGPHAEAAEGLRARMAEALGADLRALRGAGASPVGGAPLDATAVLYMLLGSSLGARVMRRRWAASRDPEVAGAGRFLALAPPEGAWRDLCAELARRPAEGGAADRVVADAAALFDRHREALAAEVPCREGVAHG